MRDRQSEIDELHHQLGLLTAERDWLKKLTQKLTMRKRLLCVVDSQYSMCKCIAPHSYEFINTSNALR